MASWKIAVALLAAVALSAAPQAGKKSDPDVKEMRDYRLSLDKIQKFADATKALMKDPAVAKCTENSGPAGNAATLNEGEKKLAACPAAMSIIKAQSLQPREYLILTAHVIGDMMAVEMKKQGTIKQYPDVISPENASFLEQNQDKIKAILAPVNGTDK